MIKEVDLLHRMYKKIPGTGFSCVNKTECQKVGFVCCVSAWLSLVELVDVFEWMKVNMNKEVISYYFTLTPRKRNDGEDICNFHTTDRKCAIYPVRSLKCRYYGHFSVENYLAKFKIKLKENCPYKNEEDRKKAPKISYQDIERNEDIINKINKQHGCYKRMSLSNWISLYFADSNYLESRELKELQKTLKIWVKFDDYIMAIVPGSERAEKLIAEGKKIGVLS